ncbi:MAG: sulfite exporter TauE/SafE family protein [Silicimonas sp.]|nr:sulfite exporter TauE/SafE family protein [Silicimonas sp.]
MSEALSGALATDGIWLVAIGAILAGIVRGFTGFGTALVFLPFAAQVLGPFEAIAAMMVKDVIAPLMHVPRALKDGQPKDVLRLGGGALFAVPIGVWILSLVDPVVFRWAVSLVALGLLVLLISGLRYRGQLTPRLVVGTGALGGFFGGCVGLPGPPVIMLYMASTLPVTAVRANLTLYLILADIILLGVLAVKGLLVSSALAIGAIMILPYLFGNWFGAWLFRPEAEHVYRWIAYAVIAGSAILGLPVWS